MEQLTLQRSEERERRIVRDLDTPVCADSFSGVEGLEDWLTTLSFAASARMADPRLEQERLIMLERTLNSARAASAALQMWAAQCLSEYRGSRTAWDLHATSELLGMSLTQFEAAARDTARHLRRLMPEIIAEQMEA